MHTSRTRAPSTRCDTKTIASVTLTATFGPARANRSTTNSTVPSIPQAVRYIAFYFLSSTLFIALLETLFLRRSLRLQPLLNKLQRHHPLLRLLWPPPPPRKSMTRSPRVDAMWNFLYVVLTLIAARSVWTIGQRPWKRVNQRRGIRTGDNKDYTSVQRGARPARPPGVRAPSTLPKVNATIKPVPLQKDHIVARLQQRAHHSQHMENHVAAAAVDANVLDKSRAHHGEAANGYSGRGNTMLEIPMIPITDGEFLGDIADVVLPSEPAAINEPKTQSPPIIGSVISNVAHHDALSRHINTRTDANADAATSSFASEHSTTGDESFGDEFWKAVERNSDGESTTTKESSVTSPRYPDAKSERFQTSLTRPSRDSGSSFLTDSSGGYADISASTSAVLAELQESLKATPAQAAAPVSLPPPPQPVRPSTSRKQSYRPLPLPPVPDKPGAVNDDRRSFSSASFAERRPSGRYGKELPSPPQNLSPELSSESEPDESAATTLHPQQHTLSLSPKSPHLPTFLDLSKRSLTALPTLSTDHCRVLTRVLLARNKLTHLPDLVLDHMPNIRTLDLSDNLLKSVPPGLGRLNRLKELYLAGNGIERLEAELGACVHVEIIGLSRNRLYEIAPAAITTLAHLRILDLSSNYLRTLPPALHAVAPTLQKLLVDDNPIEQSLIKLVNPILTTSRRTRDPSFSAASSSSVLKAQQSAGNIKSILAGMSGRRKDEAALEVNTNMDDANLQLSEEDRKSMASFDSGVADVDRRALLLIKNRTGVEDDAKSHEILTRLHYSDPDLLVPPGPTSISRPRSNPASAAYAIHLHRLLNYLRDVNDLNLVGPSSRRNSQDDQTILTQEQQEQQQQPPQPELGTLLGPPPTLPNLDPVCAVNSLLSSVVVPATTPNPEKSINNNQYPNPNKSPEPANTAVSDRRTQVITEIVTTERTYVRELEALVTLYLHPLQQEHIFTDTEMELVFGNLESLLKYHKEQLLPEFELRLKDPRQALGKTLVDMAPHLQAYEMYYNKFDAATSFITLLESIGNSSASNTHSSGSNSHNSKKHKSSIDKRHAHLKPLAKRFRQFTTHAKQNPLHASQLNLQSFLILPVQRLPRYKLLVDQLLKVTPPDHPECAQVDTAQKRVADAVRQCNERKRAFEATTAGAAILHRLVDPATTLSPYSNSNTHKHATDDAATDARLYFAAPTELRVVKYVERDWTSALDLTTVVERGTKKKGKKRVERERIGRVYEWRVGKLCKQNERAGGAGAGAEEDAAALLSENGIASLAGVQYPFYVIGSRLLWCAPRRPNANNNNSTTTTTTLPPHRRRPTLDLAPPTTGPPPPTDLLHLTATAPPVPATEQLELVRALTHLTAAHVLAPVAEKESLARLTDGTCVLYLVGPDKVLKALMDAVREMRGLLAT
ncbi:hypothetical protein PhCBS80983_g03222 [Powellomyces hirtus]|uniref:DH domain-containing protein n=1 Tax=Powellomyces hirtus TaxID=109895 RepID=A0A507E2I0_9FUNG|nr:hypothetical protein PhCBS80983_g03222 [Powellomyces hirtus]